MDEDTVIEQAVDGAEGQEIYSAPIEEKAPYQEAAAAPQTHWSDDVVLPDGVELTDKTKEYSSLGEFIKGAQSDRKMIAAKGILPPAEDATEEEKAAFIEAVRPHLGSEELVPPLVPEAGGYERPDWLSEADTLSDERKDDLFTFFNDHGFTQAHADAALELYRAEAGKDLEMFKASVDETRNETMELLKAEHGDQYNDTVASIEKWMESHPEISADPAFEPLLVTKAFNDLVIQFIAATSEDRIAENESQARADASAELDRFMADPNTKQIFKEGRAGQPEYDNAVKRRNQLVLQKSGRT